MNKTIQEMRESVRRACVAANPEIAELKFGCRVKIIGGNEAVILYKWFEHAEMNRYDVYTGDGGIEGRNEDELEIIGRDIRLADVLLAASKVGAVTKTANYLINRVMLGTDDIDYSGKSLEEDVRWNLLNDNLDDQSGGTVEFVYGLLNENK